MSSLVITVKSPETSATLLSQLVAQSANGAQECVLLGNYFSALAAGVKIASFEVNTAAASPVKASGTLTLVYASISNNDTCVIGATTLTAVTGTPANENQFKKETDLATTVTNFLAAIAAHSVLKGIVTATAVAGVVTITCKVSGEIGNAVKLTGSTGITASAAYLASGAGGGTGTAVSYSRGY